MARARLRKQPTFVWQAILIVLPVAALTVFGLASLRQDKLTVEREARERAQELASRAAPAISQAFGLQVRRYEAAVNAWFTLHAAALAPGSLPANASRPQLEQAVSEWNADFASVSLAAPPEARVILNDQGEALEFVPPAPPVPPGWLALLAPAQAELRQKALTLELEKSATSARLEAWEAYRASLTEPDARANAELAILRLRTLAADSADAVAQFTRFAAAHPRTESEAGLNLASLALWEALQRLGPQDVVPAGLLELLGPLAAARNSSFLTARLLARAAEVGRNDSAARPKALAQLQALWDARRKTQLIAVEACERIPHPPRGAMAFWLGTDEGQFLAVLEPPAPGGSCSLHLLPEPVLERMMAETVGQGHWAAPAYAALEVRIAGASLGGAASGRSSGAELARAELAPSSPEIPGLEVRVRLEQPALLYARQRQRQLLFSLLIVAASLSALAGLLAAYRSFRRQRQLNELQSSFVSSVSHELRAPIASVRLMAESLERGRITEPGRQREYFRFIGRECGRLSSLIENVLDFSRIEQGRKRYELEPTDLPALVRHTVELLRVNAAERAVRLELAMDEPGLAAQPLQPCVDGKALQQALINLIDNAIKHSAQGQSVTIGLQVDSDPARPQSARLLLWVEDQGPGIPAAEHEKIFERFYRLGSELRRETEGVGIGLSIVKHIVEGHGGRVRVRSRVGEGSRFTVELPLAPAEAARGGM